MKKILLSLLLSSILFAECTQSEKDEAMRLWKKSQVMNGKLKFKKLKEASRVCSLDRIIIDANIYLIKKALNKNNVSKLMLDKLNSKITESRSLNNSMYVYGKNTTRSNNSKIIARLTHRLASMQNGRVMYLKPSKNDIGKGFASGKVVSIPLHFRNNQDRVIGNKNIDTLANVMYDIVGDNSSVEFIITGYASSRGNAIENQKLSERRAYNAKRYIEQKYPKIKGHILSSGSGETDILCDEGFAEDVGTGEYECRGGSENEKSSRRVEVIQK